MFATAAATESKDLLSPAKEESRLVIISLMYCIYLFVRVRTRKAFKNILSGFVLFPTVMVK